MPSLLETFSTSYLEAIAASRMIIVPKKGFAREVCQDAAIYFDENDISSLFNIIYNYRNFKIDTKIYENILSHYGTQLLRYNKIINALNFFHSKSFV